MKKTHITWLSIIAFALLTISGCQLTQIEEQSICLPESSSQIEAVTIPPNPAKATVVVMDSYYEKHLVEGGIYSPNDYEIQGKLRGGMVPHHQLASDMMAGFFKLAGEHKEDYDTVIIVAPSHFPENANSDIVTSTAHWNSPYGMVTTNTTIVERILANSQIGAENNPYAVATDHGGAGLVPFVANYLPDAQIAVFNLANNLSKERLEVFRSTIGEICQNERILLVVSVDCSHYLSPQKAEKKDVDTAQSIETFDISKIMGYTDENIDSPQALTTLLVSAMANDWGLTRLDHANSSDKLPHGLSDSIYFEGVTSYYVYGATTG